MAEGGIANGASIKVQRLDGFEREEVRTAFEVSEFTSTAPYLKDEIIEGIMAVGMGCEGRSIKIGLWLGEEACDLLKFFPGCRG